MSTAELVAASGLHENTVRGHLEQLRADGHLIRRRAARRSPGRPAWLWQIAERADLDVSYADLAVALSSALAAGHQDPGLAARASGARWGEKIAADFFDEPSTKKARTTFVAAVVEVMRRQGFDPECDLTELSDSERVTDKTTVMLRRCPLIQAARGNESVVCAAHEGMIEGIARRWMPGVESELTPYANGHQCALTLRVAQ